MTDGELADARDALIAYGEGRRYMSAYDLEEVASKLLTETVQMRTHTAALLVTLPRCNQGDCQRPATYRNVREGLMAAIVSLVCDKCARGKWPASDLLPYAEPVRALTRALGWTS